MLIDTATPDENDAQAQGKENRNVKTEFTENVCRHADEQHESDADTDD